MVMVLLKKLFADKNTKVIREASHLVGKINSFEASIQALSDYELRAKTIEFRNRIAAGETLDSLLPESFAVVREATIRTLGMRLFDVQLIGGIVLHQGMIAEMKTGEGKTLVALLPSYLNALVGKGVHIVTVNDYLAKRDAEWMGKVHRFLGLSVGCIISSISDTERKSAYEADITYGTNNELGFDYLRDNLKLSKEEMVQRGRHFAIVDEVDSILIDESRTPLIISGSSEITPSIYKLINKMILSLSKEDYEADKKMGSVALTESGIEKMEKMLIKEKLIQQDSGLFDAANVKFIHYINQSIKSHALFFKDVDYMLVDGKVVIVDEFTGRVLEGRRFSEGLHQAIEAKENVEIQAETHTLASITFQNYFRTYEKIAGMSGTVCTEAKEFLDIYHLPSVAIPTHRPVARKDDNDLIYRTITEKEKAIMTEIKKAHTAGQPVLLGTVSVEKSERFSTLLKSAGIKHNVLNAKHHDKEAIIIAQAGRKGAVTVATNMAGRGTDIKLGGNAEMLHKAGLGSGKALEELDLIIEAEREVVKNAGGLLIVGSERHESRRIDDQLRGRSGRQGDPGRSIFFLSLEDDLMRLFGSEKISSLLGKLGFKEGESIEHEFVTSAIGKAQKKVEMRNFEVRRNLLRFDDVISQQRLVIYERRLAIMEATDVLPELYNIIEEIIPVIIKGNMNKGELNLPELQDYIHHIFGINIDLENMVKDKEMPSEEEVFGIIKQTFVSKLEACMETVPKGIYIQALKQIMLITLDQNWKNHLARLDELRQGIHLRAYAQKDPLNEYRFEGFAYFKVMLEKSKEEALTHAMHFRYHHLPEMSEEKVEIPAQISPPTIPVSSGTPSPNALCECGSGLRRKHCHGKLKKASI